MLTTPRLMQDSSIPTSKLLPGYSAVAGYIGGDTPHVWTQAEWGRFKGVPKLPIFVNNISGDDRATGRLDGFKVLNLLYDLGVQPGTAVAYDLETRIVPERTRGFRSVIEWAGFRAWIYGSRSTLFANPAIDYWVADYTGLPHWPSRPTRACQYKAGVHTPGEPDIDVSCIRLWQVRSGALWT